MFEDFDFHTINQRIAESEEILEIKTTPARLLILVSWLQLALRHPDESPSKAVATELAHRLGDILCSVIPEARPLVEMGFQPSFDINPEYFRQEFDEKFEEG